jgi:hypothetical protein
MTLLPNRDTPSVCFVAPDVNLAWQEIGEHLLHDARTYAEWNPGDQTSVGIADVSDVDELRAMSRTHRIFNAEEAIAQFAAAACSRLRRCAVAFRLTSPGNTCVMSTKR